MFSCYHIKWFQEFRICTSYIYNLLFMLSLAFLTNQGFWLWSCFSNINTILYSRYIKFQAHEFSFLFVSYQEINALLCLILINCAETYIDFLYLVYIFKRAHMLSTFEWESFWNIACFYSNNILRWIFLQILVYVECYLTKFRFHEFLEIRTLKLIIEELISDLWGSNCCRFIVFFFF